jgi:hypothetical protein
MGKKSRFAALSARKSLDLHFQPGFRKLPGRVDLPLVVGGGRRILEGRPLKLPLFSQALVVGGGRRILEGRPLKLPLFSRPSSSVVEGGFLRGDPSNSPSDSRLGTYGKIRARNR